MSLYKQLWLAVVFIVTASFIGSFAVSSLSAKGYLQEQLRIKNADNTSALALSLSQSDPDPVLIELMLSAQFDTGHYQYIRLIGPDGKVLVERMDQQELVEAPLWFTQLFPINAAPGVAQVQNGWQQLGTLSIKSHARYAYTELWSSTKRLLTYFLLQALVLGVLGSLAIRVITKPLGEVVKQARAIGERRFITTPEPATLEFKAVVSSMNTLSTRIKDMLQQEAGRLEMLRQEMQVDQVTGLLNRKPLLNLLSTTLERDDARASGTIIILRISDLQALNELKSRVVIDALLVRFGTAINELLQQQKHWSAGRLNGSDFAIVAPEDENPEQMCHNIQQTLLNIGRELQLDDALALPAAITSYSSGESSSAVLARLNKALLTSQQKGHSTITLAPCDPDASAGSDTRLDWAVQLRQSFQQHHFSLACYPVATLSGELIHQESPVRLQIDQQRYDAAQFLPWINRLDLALELDREVITLALAQLAEPTAKIGINLSPQSIADPRFIDWILQTLRAQQDKASRLWIEIPEYGVYQHLEGFRTLCQQLKIVGCQVGIKHLGYEISQIGQLHDLGLDYVKIDASLIRDIDSNVANQALLRALCMIVHSIGLIAIAEGVQKETEWGILGSLGLDGATGPIVTHFQQ